MAKLNCSKVEEYPSSDGTRCCDRCAPGQYKQAECDSTKRTVCAKCEDRFYTNTKNHLPKCQPCTSCNSNNKQKEFKKCTAQEDTVCECVAGFYCTDDQCTHCLGLTKCHVGKGVMVQATRTKDTVCAPCVNGTYSNVTDDHSPCRIHT
ncbi:tumor necrosis factor receptor superfamily member 1B-like, partial [Plectropomus leopardus]|uniref:tumor necrosis factor receptor superfamily member 1B-like n=1 Tax=Plectropomus leopardus TaxID=160734 RepID=UPI001C4DA5F3